jgi:hypothetical protein
VITENTVELLLPEKSTRADAIHTLGDPSERIEADRFFIYRWERIEGYVIFIPPFWPAREPGFAGREDHYLLLEFTADNRVRRLKFIKRRDMLNETLDHWTKERD